MSNSDVVRIEPRGGTVLRITHRSCLAHDTDFGYLLRDNPSDSVFASFAAETIPAAERVHGTVAWHRPEGLVDLAAHVLEEHAEVGEWEPGDSVVIRPASEEPVTEHVGLPPPTTVADLCQLLDRLPGDTLVLVDGYGAV